MSTYDTIIGCKNLTEHIELHVEYCSNILIPLTQNSIAEGLHAMGLLYAD